MSMKRRDFMRSVAAVPAAAVLSRYSALAAPERKKVKITGMKVMLVRGTFDWPMVKIETDAGITGIGESYWGHGVKDIMLGYLKPLIVGEDPLDIDRLYTKMIQRTGGAGAIAGATVTAISGVEIALWDLAGKILGQPVVKLLGGQYRDKVRAYWTTGAGDPLDPAACRQFAAKLKQHPYGFKAVKLGYLGTYEKPAGRNLSGADLLKNTKAFMNLREALGDEIEIIAHCHWEFDLMTALALARAVAPARPWWLEDPMPPDYSPAWTELTRQSPVPIGTGENLYTRHGFKPFLVNGGCQVAQIDIPKAGGLLEAKKIADLADIFYIPIAAHNVASPIGTLASAHCAAAIRDFTGHEYNYGRLGSIEAWEKFAVYDRPFLKDGYIQISDAPGLGVALNEDHVRAHLAEGEVWWG